MIRRHYGIVKEGGFDTETELTEKKRARCENRFLGFPWLSIVADPCAVITQVGGRWSGQFRH